MATGGSAVNFADDIEHATDDLNRSGLSEPGITSSGSLRTNRAGAAMLAAASESSSSENTPLLLRSDQFRVGIISGNYDADDREFERIFRDVEQAIDRAIYPQRISQGSSGSYFVRNSDGVGILMNVTRQYLIMTVVIVRELVMSQLLLNKSN